MPRNLHKVWQVVPAAQVAFDVQPKSRAEAGDGKIGTMLSNMAARTARPTRRFVTGVFIGRSPVF
jgi:hypothetical protein